MTMTMEQLQARINELEAAAAKKPSGGLKIGEKGGLSVYGIGRFPVTLYASQWGNLLDKAAEIKAFIAANTDKLASKPAK